MKNKAMIRIAYVILLISGLYVISTTGWILTENKNILPVMELLTIWAAIVIVLFMATLHQQTDEKQKTQSMSALVFSSCMATVTTLNHFLYLTVFRQIYLHTTMPSWLLLYSWPSITKGLECVAWSFFLGLSMLFASSALRGFGNIPIVWTMRISGILTLAGLIGPITGNMNYYIISTIGYSVGFLVLSIELIIFFHKNKRIS